MRKIALLGLGLILAVACTGDIEISGGSGSAVPIPTDADGNTIYEDSRVVGIITDRDGTPAEGAAVDVIATDTGSGFDEVFLTVVTLGLACLPDGDCGPGQSSIGNATTVAGGAYDVVLPDGYLAGYETDTDWIVTARRGGAVSLFEFEANAAVQEAPPLPLWEAAPTIAGDGSLLSITVDPPPEVDDPVHYEQRVRFHDLEGSELWWMQGRTVDARVLEDVPTRLAGTVFADLRVAHGDTRTIYHQRISTPPVERTGTLVPISRAAPCTTSPPTVGCFATDGDLLTGPPGETPVSTTVDLQDRREIGLVVVRGCRNCDVEASADGEAWQLLEPGVLDGAPGMVAAPDGALSARFVRVRQAADGGGWLQEISVWPPTAPAPDQDPQAGLLEGADDDGGRSWGEGLAIAAAVLAVAGLAYGAFRVRRQLR